MCCKKIWAILLIAILGLSAFPVLADEVTGADLQTLLMLVKEKIEIPAEFEDFSYSVNSREARGNQWRLRWSRQEPAYETITVTADDKGEILSYYQSMPEVTGLLPADFTREDAIQCAEEFLYRVNTTTRERFFVSSTDSHMGAFTIRFEEKINDIPVKGSSASVTVNKANRQVSDMSLSRAYREDSFPDPEKIISKETAAETYLEKIGFRLIYRTFVNYEKKTVTSYPVFVAPKQNLYAVDAFSGKVADIVSQADHDVLFDSIRQESAGGSNLKNSVVLTEAELSEIANTLPLISKQQALEIINRMFGEQFSLESASLNRHALNKSVYNWNLNLQSTEKNTAYATLDAETGMVLSYSNYQDKKETKKVVSLQQAQQTTTALFTQNAGEVSALYQLNPDKTEELEESYSLTYNRYHQNIPVEDQTLQVTLSKDGRVESYRLTYHRDTRFVPMSESTDANTQRIFNAFAQHAPYGLCYIPVTKNGTTKILLTYDFLTYDMPSLDGNTLCPVNYRGEPAKNESTPVYTDLNNHWAKKFIDLLAYNDIYMISDNQFLPDQTVTAGEFVTLLSDCMNPLPYTLRSRIEEGLSKKIVPQEEKELPLTRQMAARYIVGLLNYEKLAAKPEAFQYLFRDVAEEANRPYIMICYMLDIMKGDDSGSFHADETLTRAETAVILYNILK